MTPSILLGKGKEHVCLSAHMANRHGLVAGATGTGKTVTLRVMAEGFSRIGVPVFVADVKGDLAGMCLPGDGNPKMQERAVELGITDYAPRAAPVIFWDALAEQGHPVRTTVAAMGPLLFGRLLDLNDTQSGVLNVVFKAAADKELPLVDMKDLQAMLQYASQNARELSGTYGNVSPTSVAAIQRDLLALSEQGGDKLFGEPPLDVADFYRTDSQGQGIVSILAADKLLRTPQVYPTLLFWLLTELYHKLPEVGDLEKPKLVFFFDEAHLLFNEAPKAVVEKIEQVVRLVRSKAVGVYFVSQNPLDIPDVVLGQLGNRVQHALRAFTPRDQKAVRAAAETFRGDGTMNVQEVITQLAVGEALVSLLDEKGAPQPVERVKIAPPQSRLSAITPEERQRVIQASPLFGRYETAVDRDSAYEKLKKARESIEATSADVQVPTSRRQPSWVTIVNSFLRSLTNAVVRALERTLKSTVGRPPRRRR